MRKHLRRYAIGALAVGAVAGTAAFALPGTASDWRPTPYGLTETPAQLLPSNVSTAHPVRVVSTTVDRDGRPVITVHTATDPAAAKELVKKAQKAENAVGVEVDAPVKALGTDDPYRSQQWDLTKINVAAANTRTTGTGVTVAVIDTGVDAAHPDLAGQVLPGADFVTDTTGVSSDPNGHGTHVAGTIAALTGNGVGVAGIASGVKILPVRVLDASGSGYMSDAATGIVWAADHGANVINMSLGSTAQVAAVTNAISYARSKGVTVVAAAGNSRTSGSPTSWPAADPGVIAVAATDSADQVAYYSNQGSYVDVAAPGSSILSTYPTAKGSYATLQGTSMASPHAAAVAALIKAYSPSLTPDQVEKAMESTAVDLGAAGKDTDYGYGRIDAAAALAAVAPSTSAPTSPATTSPTATPTQSKTTSPTTSPTSVTPTPSKTTTSPTPTPTPSKTTASPTPTPSKTVAKVKPTVAISPVTQQVSYGAAAKTTFTVTVSGKPFAQRPVQVCVTDVGQAPSCTTATTGSTGGVLVSRTATAGYQAYITVPGTDTTEAVTSPTAGVTVKATLAVVRSGNTMTVTLGGAAGQSVQVQRQNGSSWVTVLTYKAVAKATVSNLTTGQRYRVVVPDAAGIVGVTSATV